jgi:hypothetical protein
MKLENVKMAHALAGVFLEQAKRCMDKPDTLRGTLASGHLRKLSMQLSKALVAMRKGESEK